MTTRKSVWNQHGNRFAVAGTFPFPFQFANQPWWSYHHLGCGGEEEAAAQHLATLAGRGSSETRRQKRNAKEVFTSFTENNVCPPVLIAPPYAPAKAMGNGGTRCLELGEHGNT